MAGKIYPKGALFLSVAIGSAGNEERGYELLTSGSSGAPMIESNQTGKTWSISWKELLDFAIAAGIDSEEQEDGALDRTKEGA